MKYIAGLSIWLLVILCVFGPFVLTFFNIINLFKKNKRRCNRHFNLCIWNNIKYNSI